MPSPTPTQLAHLQQALQDASPSEVVASVRTLKANHFPKNRWLGQRNRYATDTIKRIAADSKPFAAPAHSHLRQYLAASTVLHCFDGWGFMSRAFESLLNGDTGSAIHLAYYAELRAAVSFLAREGIGIFNTQHVWIEQGGACHIFSGAGTHETAWHALSKWAQIPTKSSSILKLFSAYGSDFDTWIAAAANALRGPAAVALASDWLATWSLDLKMLSADHLLRNEVSYRPQGLRTIKVNSDLVEVMRQFVEFWRACEPSTASSFSVLDTHLLRHALVKTYKVITSGKQPRGTHYIQYIKDTLGHLSLPDSGVLFEFLTKQRDVPSHPLLQKAKIGRGVQAGKLRAIPIIARALLLLRLATAASNDLLAQSLVKRTDLQFWWKAFGEDIGLWQQGFEPATMTQLWDDIEDVLITLSTWCDANSTSVGAYLGRSQNPFELWQFQQFARAGLWGISQ